MMRMIKHTEVQIVFTDQAVANFIVSNNFAGQITETNYFYVIVEQDTTHKFPLKDIYKINERLIFEDEK